MFFKNLNYNDGYYCLLIRVISLNKNRIKKNKTQLSTTYKSWI